MCNQDEVHSFYEKKATNRKINILLMNLLITFDQSLSYKLYFWVEGFDRILGTNLN